jgi:CRP-like cAMP-binding protein
MTQALLENLSKYQALNPIEIDTINSIVQKRNIKRRQFLLSENEVCKHYTFVLEGCFKMYKVDEKGNEHILQFSKENEWMTDISSFHSELPSELYIEAIEKSVVLQIQKVDLLHLFINFPKFDRYFRVLIENLFIQLQNRVLLNISSSAEKKYLSFLDTYPLLLNRISNVQIASYIGVTPEFLSKLRKNISSK